MSDPRILVTGDYWHADFQKLLNEFDVPATLTPVDKFQSLADQRFDLVVLAQSRPDQIGSEVIESFFSAFPLTPIVGLLGSWCEGSSRSGTPMPGVRRVYFHQWAGQFRNFVRQFRQDGITDWHQPATVTDADHAMAAPIAPQQTSQQNSSLAGCSFAVEESAECMIGVSATSHDQFTGLRDAITSMDWQVCRVDHASDISAASQQPTCLCVDGNSESDSLRERLVGLRNRFPRSPMVLVLNFPRVQATAMAAEFGIREVVAKPYDLSNLKLALERAMYSGISAEGDVQSIRTPAPHAWQAKRIVKD